jgi:hypothetical protein
VLLVMESNMAVVKSRRFAVLLFVIASAATFRCGTYHLPAVAEPPDFCITPTGPYWRPVICVDETNLTANQRVTVASDVEPDDHKTPSNRPVTIFWRTHHQFNLQLEFADTSCVDQVQCDGHGHCSAVVKPLAMVQGVKQNRRCTYRMLDGSNAAKKDDDGDIVIQPCCW